MEFRFNVNDVLKQPIVEIGHTLIPSTFKGDRRALWDTLSKVTDVVNAMGSASATAQNLTKPITTADRLRNSEQQTVYLLVDNEAFGGKGAVTGMLKTGKKGLYVFDREGHHYQVQSPCILDFYVHESRQRSGLGKKLFEHMLQKEQVQPDKLAIDRPSDKFLAFLQKHYSLTNPIRQMNNYVVYDGFFPEKEKAEDSMINNNSETPSKQAANGLQPQITSPYGRYGAPRPPCSMGQIIHNQTSAVAAQEPSGEVKTPSQYNSDTLVVSEKHEQDTASQPKLDRPQTLSLQTSDEKIESEVQNDNASVISADELDNIENDIEKVEISTAAKLDDAETTNMRKTPHLTDQGFFDLKFYHNKLW